MEHNSRLLTKYDFNFTRIVAAYKATTMEPGSHFCPVSELDELPRNHDDWPTFHPMLSEGMKYPASNLIELKRRETLERNIECRNHSKNEGNEQILADLSKGDTYLIFGLLIMFDAVCRLQSTEAYPLNLVRQKVAKGVDKVIPKLCMVHKMLFDQFERNELIKDILLTESSLRLPVWVCTQ